MAAWCSWCRGVNLSLGGRRFARKKEKKKGRKEEGKKERRKEKRIGRKAGRFYTLVPVGRWISERVKIENNYFVESQCQRPTIKTSETLRGVEHEQN